MEFVRKIFGQVSGSGFRESFRLKFLTYILSKIVLDSLLIIFDPKTKIPPPTTCPKPIPTPTRPSIEAAPSKSFVFPTEVV